MKVIAVGDKISVVTMNGNIVRAEVSVLFEEFNKHKRVGFRWHTSWAYSEISYNDEEHGRWIRGYHDNDSDEIRALKTAAAMDDSTRTPAIGYGGTGRTWGPVYENGEH